MYLPEVLQGLLTVQYQRFESLFKRTPNADDFIIYNTVGGVMDPDHLSSYWGDVLDGLGLPHVRFHDIRHTFATRAIEQGIDVATVSGLLGHADVTTTTHYYVHPRDASMRKAMAAVAPDYLHRKALKRKYLKRQGVCIAVASTSQNVDE